MKTIKLHEFAKELEKFTNLHVDQIKAGVVSGVARSIPDLVAASPVDQGFYAQSWDMTVDEVAVTLGNYAPHAPIIEDGARPFTPPIAPLLAWAKRVLGDGSQPPEYSQRVKSLAYATQAKIAREGMKPKHILENMIPQIIENIKQELANV